MEFTNFYENNNNCIEKKIDRSQFNINESLEYDSNENIPRKKLCISKDTNLISSLYDVSSKNYDSLSENETEELFKKMLILLQYDLTCSCTRSPPNYCVVCQIETIPSENFLRYLIFENCSDAFALEENGIYTYEHIRLTKNILIKEQNIK